MRKIIVTGLMLLLIPVFAFPQIDDYAGQKIMDDSGKKVSLDFEEVALVNLLKVLSQQSGLNFVANESVQERKITLYLEDVPLTAAMDILFSSNNLSYDYFPKAKMFVVKEMGKPSITKIAKTYKLKYARVKSSRLQQEIDDIMDSGESSSSSSSDSSDSGDTDDGIAGAVKEALTENGKVIEDALTNSLIVIDVPSQFTIIDQIIASLDIQQPKVLIEVEILDVSKRLIDKLGTNWPETIASLDVTGSRVTRFPFFGNKADNTSYTFTDITSPSGNWEFGALNGNHFAPSVLTVLGAELTLKFLKTNSDTKSLARPKILTLSNETAEIKITTEEAIGIQKTVDENGGEDYTIERAETGTRLRVTPQVNEASGEITLIVESVEKEAQSSGFTTTGSQLITGTIKDPEERSTKTVVRIKDGEVLLLGGLIKKTETDEGSHVPVFSKIPVLGKMFQNKSGDTQERELMIFLTPKILGETQLEFSRAFVPVTREQGCTQSKSVSVKSALDKYSKELNGKAQKIR